MDATPDWVGHGAWPWLAPLWILFWVLVLWTAARFVFRRSGRASCARRGSMEHRAGDILAERFARGEIDADEYRSRLEILGQ
jgi:putative membrane protein